MPLKLLLSLQSEGGWWKRQIDRLRNNINELRGPPQQLGRRTEGGSNLIVTPDSGGVPTASEDDEDDDDGGGNKRVLSSG